MRNDQTLWFLSGFIVFFTMVVILVSIFMPQNQAIYTLFAGNVGGFAGALLMYFRLKPPDGPPPPTGVA